MKVVLGVPSRSVHCEDVRQARDITLNKSVFHPGWVLTGCAPAAHTGKEGYNKKTTAIESQNSPSSGSTQYHF